MRIETENNAILPIELVFADTTPLVDLSKVARDQGAIVVAAFPAISTIKSKGKKKFGLGAFERGNANTGATFSRRGGSSTGNPYSSGYQGIPESQSSLPGERMGGMTRSGKRTFGSYGSVDTAKGQSSVNRAGTGSGWRGSSRNSDGENDDWNNNNNFNSNSNKNNRMNKYGSRNGDGDDYGIGNGNNQDNWNSGSSSNGNGYSGSNGSGGGGWNNVPCLIENQNGRKLDVTIATSPSHTDDVRVQSSIFTRRWRTTFAPQRDSTGSSRNSSNGKEAF
ncbi:hypothetical protein B9Z55_010105 [Caenorhabditis nigoni]|uniref:Uncharacterized protein n=1 Tax=Caenorhabditis nigoni TaxID=1611254 RepID=A0A2G5UF09_9PELO|nr:hypothetical protein B9Z55_010105 [Caenorhabditis nigoni]